MVHDACDRDKLTCDILLFRARIHRIQHPRFVYIDVLVEVLLACDSVLNEFNGLFEAQRLIAGSTCWCVVWYRTCWLVAFAMPSYIDHCGKRLGNDHNARLQLACMWVALSLVIALGVVFIIRNGNLTRGGIVTLGIVVTIPRGGNIPK